MSYILDALKKSEERRPPGPVPDLFAVHGPLPPKAGPSRLLLAVAAVALLASGAGLAAWVALRSGRVDGVPARPARPAAAEAPSAVAPPPATAAAPAAEPAPAARPAPVARRSAAPEPPAATRAAAASVPVTPAPLPAQPAAAAAAAVAPAPVSAPAAPAQPAVLVSPQPEPPAAPAAAAPPAAPAAATAAPPSPQPTPEAAQPPPAAVPAVPPPDGRILDRSELPDAIRAGVQSLALTGHVWSDDPGMRLVTVQDRLVKEGGEASPGVRLEEITREGAVFAYRGYRFRLGGR